MTYLIPPNVRRNYFGDSTLWNGYELIETPEDDGVGVHQTAIQDRLNELQALVDTIQIISIETRVNKSDVPQPENIYLTTLWFTVLGDPDTYPITP